MEAAPGTAGEVEPANSGQWGGANSAIVVNVDMDDDAASKLAISSVKVGGGLLSSITEEL